MSHTSPRYDPQTAFESQISRVKKVPLLGVLLQLCLLRCFDAAAAIGPPSMGLASAELGQLYAVWCTAAEKYCTPALLLEAHLSGVSSVRRPTLTDAGPKQSLDSDR